MHLVDLLSAHCALFLDFDGTLVDIAPQPEDVTVPAGLVPTLRALRTHLGGAIAVISGRPIGQIDVFLAPLQLPAAGVHGAERRGADGTWKLLAPLPLDTMTKAARALAREHPRLRIETKRGSIALHYRQAPELEALCVQAFEAAVAQSPGLTLLLGKMVVEAKPAGASKGSAIETFMGEPAFAGRRPVFIGDDVTDEAGFAAVQRLGGIGIKVGDGPSVAHERLDTPAEMRRQLLAVVAALAAKAVA